MEGGLSSRSVRYVHAVCRWALSDAVDWDLIDRNPVEKAKPPNLDARVIHPLTPDESRVF